MGPTSDSKGLSGMGTAFQDYDNDGRPDIITTVLPRELYALFHNDRDGSFTYDSLKTGSLRHIDVRQFGLGRRTGRF